MLQYVGESWPMIQLYSRWSRLRRRCIFSVRQTLPCSVTALRHCFAAGRYFRSLNCALHVSKACVSKQCVVALHRIQRDVKRMY